MIIGETLKKQAFELNTKYGKMKFEQNDQQMHKTKKNEARLIKTKMFGNRKPPTKSKKKNVRKRHNQIM